MGMSKPGWYLYAIGTLGTALVKIGSTHGTAEDEEEEDAA
jgi:hypothetical protein